MDERDQEKKISPGAKKDRMLLLLLCAALLAAGALVMVPRYGSIGVLWTLVAAVATAYNAYLAFGGKYTGPQPPPQDLAVVEDREADVRVRLEKLEELFNKNQISYSEYMRRRMEIVNGDSPRGE
ncbi:MAG: hypothetical protein J5927_06860 [Oscillospiraceae bacterium]|nr:hypothetical protein [Oscillospiraceae bacterium]